jgi:3-phenylpropionate/trans-cinnamate dioxygenase ferredoxin component
MNQNKDWIDAAAETDLPPGTSCTVDVDDVSILVANVDGRYYAIEDVCSHEEEILSTGTLEGCEITCPRHGARFSVITGEALSAPAYEPVATFPVRIEGGMVQVRAERIYVTG